MRVRVWCLSAAPQRRPAACMWTAVSARPQCRSVASASDQQASACFWVFRVRSPSPSVWPDACWKQMMALKRQHAFSSTSCHMQKAALPRMFSVTVMPLGNDHTAILSCIPAAVGKSRKAVCLTSDGKRDSTALQRDASAAKFFCSAAASAACSRQRAAAALARDSSSVMTLQVDCTRQAASRSMHSQVHMLAIALQRFCLGLEPRGLQHCSMYMNNDTCAQAHAPIQIAIVQRRAGFHKHAVQGHAPLHAPVLQHHHLQRVLHSPQTVCCCGNYGGNPPQGPEAIHAEGADTSWFSTCPDAPLLMHAAAAGQARGRAQQHVCQPQHVHRMPYA